MHREISERLEDVLSGAPTDLTAKHLTNCDDCRGEIAAMEAQATLVRQLRAPSQIEPRAGFYARVLERMEAEGPISIWNLFVESPFGKRIALASFALAMLLGIYLVTAERIAEPIVAGQPAVQGSAGRSSVQVCSGPACTAIAVQSASPMMSVVTGEDAPGAVLNRLDQDVPNDDMLVNLVTYREQ